MKVTTVKSARKAIGKCGKCGCELPKGSAYRWWKFRYGGKRIRCTKPGCAPKGSELVNSPYISGCMAAQESMEEALGSATCVADVQSALESAAEEITNMGEEARASFDNMPENLQMGGTGEMLEGRADACESLASELESAAGELEEDDARDLDPEDEDDWVTAIEAQGVERDEGESDEDWAQRCRDAVAEENGSRLLAACEKAGDVEWEYES